MENPGEMILLGEDEPALRRLAVRILRAGGYTVNEAATGARGLAAGSADSERRIQMVVTDSVMPQLNGKKLAEAVRSARPGIPILFVSGYAEALIPDPAAVG